MSKKLSEEQKADAMRLKEIYARKKAEGLDITQEKIGIELGDRGQGAVGNYLGGKNALNIKAALVFSRMLQVKVSDFSPTLQQEIEALVLYYLSTKSGGLAEVISMFDALRPEQQLHLARVARTYLPEASLEARE